MSVVPFLITGFSIETIRLGIWRYDLLHIKVWDRFLTRSNGNHNPESLHYVQMACETFFLKTVPLLDEGDDVAMILTPQAFHNLDVGCDIFNHSNIHFWE